MAQAVLWAMVKGTNITMDSAALYRLMAWLSPSYPVGAFSYSHGIEWLVESGAIKDANMLGTWITDILTLGSGRNDAILMAEGWRACGKLETLCTIAEYASAFCASAERALESQSQGQAFSDVTRRTWASPTLDRLAAAYPHPICYPVAVGVAAADHGIALAPALNAYCHAFAANLVSAGIRLVPLGHSDGQRVMKRLEPAVEIAARAGETAGLLAISNTLIMADIAAMKHETQYTRLFRS
jgi:urease accessory protein